MDKELERSKVWLVIKKPKHENQYIQISKNKVTPNPEYWPKAKIIEKGLNYSQAFNKAHCMEARAKDREEWIYAYMTIKDWDENKNLQMMITETLI